MLKQRNTRKITLFKGSKPCLRPILAGVFCTSLLLLAQAPGDARRDQASPPVDTGTRPRGGGPGLDGPPPGFDGPPPGFGGPPNGGPRFGGRGGGGPGPMQEQIKLLKQFDKAGDGKLNAEERKAARESLATQRSNQGGRRMGPPGGMGGAKRTPTPGPHLTPAEVKSFGKEAWYDPTVVRTLFLEFADADWEKEMSEFYHTDVDVPAKLTVDGKVYPEVGLHFRGASSFFGVQEGLKHSLNISMNYGGAKRDLGGYKTLDLLNSHDDPTFLHSILYSVIARDYIPAPKANFMRVVINGENCGIFVNSEQFNKDSIKEWFGTTKGARWKVPGSPRARGGLEYLGEDAAAYKSRFTLKSKEDAKAWKDLINLCKVLNQTPPEELEKALGPILDIEGTLKFLALDNTLINNDGYWIRSSDYSIYEDEKSKFHILPHDSNETFSMPEGGMFGGPRVEGVKLHPLVAEKDSAKPLLSKLLAVPALKARYLGYVRDIAEKWLDWGRLGPIATQYQSLIVADLKTDDRKLYSTETIIKVLDQDVTEEGFRGSRRLISLKNFATERRAYLLSLPEVNQAIQPPRAAR